MSTEKKGMRLTTGVAAVIAAAIAVAAAVFSWWQLSNYEDNLLEIFAKQQDQYVELAVDQINLEAHRSDQDIVNEVLASISGSSSQFWTLSKKNSLVFVKDVTDSTRYRGFSSKTYYRTDSAASFIQGLTEGRVSHATIQIDDRDYIASGTVFEYNGTRYRLCLLTGEHVVIDQNAYLAARVNLGVTIGTVLVIFVGTCVGMSLRCDHTAKRLRAAEAESAELRRTVERLNDQIMGRRRFDTARSLFDMGQASVLLSKLRKTEKLPATFVSLCFDAPDDLTAFARCAQGVLDTSVVRFAAGSMLLLVFVGAEAPAAEYALSLLGEYPVAPAPEGEAGDECRDAGKVAADIPHAKVAGTYVLRAGDAVAWHDLATKLEIED